MSITDKTRKVLWGRCGSLCAICKTHLVLEPSALDSESVVGEECHIISGALTGPRYDSTFGRDRIDTPENLILLCRIHHKLVDDQPGAYPVNKLRELKTNHERWVKERLSPELRPVKIVRSSSEIPERLFLVSSAKQLLDLSDGCHARYDNYPDDLSNEDLDCVGEFLQNLADWGDILPDGPLAYVRAQKSLAENMSDLDKAGLRIYAAREKQQLRGGNTEPSNFYALHLRIVKKESG